MKQQDPLFWTLGEALWDATPAGLFLGGAPLNVAMHLRQLDIEVALISAIGDDRLGYELRRRLIGSGVNVSLLGVHKGSETGFVSADIQADGNAKYTILRDVAWDRPPIVPMPPPPQPMAVIYSSLVMRTKAAHSRFEAWLTAAGNAIRIFDVNLRPPHYNLEHIYARMEQANWVKANYEEACLLMNSSQKPVRLAKSLQKRFDLDVVLLTCDALGAGIQIGENWCWSDAPKVSVVDTIGAGDAFLATFVASYLCRKQSVEISLRSACKRAARVVSFSGAVPDLK